MNEKEWKSSILFEENYLFLLLTTVYVKINNMK